MDEEKYMRMALELAAKARGYTSPNPLVGCVIVDAAGAVVGQGYHHKAGEAHAEVNALADAGPKAQGATAYVTLEPCSHYGRTGPCCEALIKAGIKRVVAAADDPNPLVAGKGFARLQQAGVEVKRGVLAAQAYAQNEVFMHWMLSGLPFVAMKYAMTLDGKIATASGDAKWITGTEARTCGHRLRSIYDAILVGRQTVLADDPELTCRLAAGKNPLRIILDRRLNLPQTSKVFTDGKARTITVAAEDADPKKVAAFNKLPQVEVWQVPIEHNKLSLTAILQRLSREKITSVLVEGGSQVHGAFFDAGLVQRVYAFIAPKMIGGAANISPVGGRGAAVIAEGLAVKHTEIKQLGTDFLITGRVGKELTPCSQA